MVDCLGGGSVGGLVSDGVEGLLKAGWMYPDLIIMDLSLPEMDGVEAARRIHAQAKLSQIPIFVISAYLTEAVQADVRAAGCTEIFSKPFDSEVLLERIARTLTTETTHGPRKARN